ncbi:MAG: type II secretion system F family protein [Acidimicrobiaceae bacterium]|nr:type II secretion system F family protein [Acidimicrobiia bacterium]MCY4494288.1 type II secretion system F family protein [Acidimicrobiaceae bacterium]
MRVVLVVGCCVLSAVWFRPWRVRPRPLVDTPAARQSVAAGSSRGSARQRALLGVVVLGALIVGWTQPVLIVPLVFVYAVIVMRGRRASTDDDAVAKTLPEVVDLLLVGVGAGLTPRETLQRCQAWLPDPFAAAVQRALARASAGAAFADALDRAMTPLGDQVRPLVAALNAGERDGSLLAGSLLRVSDEARRLRRVAAQQRARRVPVAMLGPLLLCVLPSFALLTLVPLVLGSLSDLGVAV